MYTTSTATSLCLLNKKVKFPLAVVQHKMLIIMAVGANANVQNVNTFILPIPKTFNIFLLPV